MDRILRSTPSTVSISLFDANGDPAPPPAGANTASVVDSAGVAIAGSPFAVTVAGNLLSFTLTPAQASILDTYGVTWNIVGDGSSRFSDFQIVGGTYFSIADLRARYGTDLADPVKFPADLIRSVRNSVEDHFEGARMAGVAFVPRGRRQFLDGSGTSKLTLNAAELRKVISVKLDGVAFLQVDLDDLAVYPIGLVVRKSRGIWTQDARNVQIFYEHGYDVPPGPVHFAAMALARYELLNSPLEGGRATAVMTDVGGYRLSIAGRDGPTGLPEVDAVIESFARWPSVGGFA